MRPARLLSTALENLFSRIVIMHFESFGDSEDNMKCKNGTCAKFYFVPEWVYLVGEIRRTFYGLIVLVGVLTNRRIWVAFLPQLFNRWAVGTVLCIRGQNFVSSSEIGSVRSGLLCQVGTEFGLRRRFFRLGLSPAIVRG